MASPDAYHTLLDSLQAATGLLELPPDDPLRQDVAAVCDQLMRSTFRIAVFGPFNYGKSTLLNAVLGERALPIDLIPTTGAAIAVRYSETLQTQIQLRDGQVIQQSGTEILKHYAILDDHRRMREDVAAVTVGCPHPLLQMGVELIDLPGTDDREAQEALVKNHLLTVDLVVQVLDGRKLMTLAEREHLRDWLLDRGIATVVFVVNFLNLLEPEDQKQVYHRLRSVAESFRAQLPAGVSNLYRVDALPALRARLKGDQAAAQVAGLPAFEAALQTIFVAQQEAAAARLPRVRAIAQRVQQALHHKTTGLAQDIAQAQHKQQQRLEIQQQAATLLQNGFNKSVAAFRDWLALSNLVTQHHSDATQALQQQQFRVWATGDFKRTAIDHQQAVVKWVHQACEFFGHERPQHLLVHFPPDPTLAEPEPVPEVAPTGKSGVTPIALATGLGWVLGGPVGGAILGSASYLLNKSLETPAAPEPTVVMNHDPDPAFIAAYEYLAHFSALNQTTLESYVAIAQRVLGYEAKAEPTALTHQHHYLNLMQTTLDRLAQSLSAVDSVPDGQST